MMKKVISFIALLLLMTKLFSQVSTLSKDYLKKSKTQKTIGWVMLGGGVAMTTIALVAASNVDPTLEDPFGVDRNTGRVVVATAGAGIALGSIPFFISSAKNKRRAAEVSFNNQRILFPQQNVLVLKAQPAVTLKIGL